MSAPRSPVIEAIDELARTGPAPPKFLNLDLQLDEVLNASEVRSLLLVILDMDAYPEGAWQQLAATDALPALPALRRLRTSLSVSVATFVGLLRDVVAGVDREAAPAWQVLVDQLRRSDRGQRRLIDVLRAGPEGAFWRDKAEQLVVDDPHARYATSLTAGATPRWSAGMTEASSKR